MSVEVLAIGSDNLVRLDNLKNASTDAYVNTATVNFVLKDADGNVVVGSTPMPYVSASNGRYEGTIDDTVPLAENGLYTIEITATDGSTVLFRKIPCIAKFRSNK
ncbi:MAG: hypothetical protein KatS3mg105_1247 [Gemmatales bacterium]|nr:MAG: hypothetical protein KatS3mg105_1247 [Gemmatales bacterium]